MLLITYVVVILIFSFGIAYLAKYYKSMKEAGSDLNRAWEERPKFYSFMKVMLPIIMIGFGLIVLNALLSIILIILQ